MSNVEVNVTINGIAVSVPKGTPYYWQQKPRY